ncbi:MAG: hypothetical protein HY577_01125 [Candidatus Nealsonbacteria bacterium]|nr:hypothetical protein [Candidatus Nealsonbacteria bacterium]
MKTKIIILTIVVVIAGGLIVLKLWPNLKPTSVSNLDPFVRCLTEKKAVLYGAFWCPHCQTQKEMFGSAAKQLPYVECSSPDGRSQLAVCQEKKIEGYPTWEFADGSRLAAVTSLKALAEKTGCSLPTPTK